MTEAEFERHTGCPRTHGKAVFGTLAAQEAKGGKTRKAMITRTIQPCVYIPVAADC